MMLGSFMSVVTGVVQSGSSDTCVISPRGEGWCAVSAMAMAKGEERERGRNEEGMGGEGTNSER